MLNFFYHLSNTRAIILGKKKKEEEVIIPYLSGDSQCLKPLIITVGFIFRSHFFVMPKQ